MASTETLNDLLWALLTSALFLFLFSTSRFAAHGLALRSKRSRLQGNSELVDEFKKTLLEDFIEIVVAMIIIALTYGVMYGWMDRGARAVVGLIEYVGIGAILFSSPYWTSFFNRGKASKSKLTNRIFLFALLGVIFFLAQLV